MNDNDKDFNNPSAGSYIRVEKFMPVNNLKNKVGVGGLPESILISAQHLIDNNSADFPHMAEEYLDILKNSAKATHENLIHALNSSHNNFVAIHHAALLKDLLYPVMELKANGGMFGYGLVTTISNRLIEFLDMIEHVDFDVIEIIEGFEITIRMIIETKMSGDGGLQGAKLFKALDDACKRYANRHPGNLLNNY